MHQSDLTPSNGKLFLPYQATSDPFLVFILDTWNNVFIWVGAESNETEQEEVQALAKEYLETSPSKEKVITKFTKYKIPFKIDITLDQMKNILI